jgi:1-acyl-sn-glycerol-3-phosphate acyltransferase
MALSLVLFIPYLFILPFRRAKDHYVSFITGGWSYYMLRIGGIKIKTSGNINIPDHGNFIAVSNHQSSLDIPLMLAVIPFKVSFISKKEVLFLPFFNIWFFALGCLSIDRKKPIAARRKIEAFLARKRYNPVLLFPEGTRSKGSKAGRFKTGGLLNVFNQKIKVLPVRIDGSYKSFEEKGHISAGIINVHFLPVVEPDEEKDFSEFVKNLEKKLS